MKADERTAAVMRASNTWGYNFIVYGLLVDIVYRSVVLHEAAWDLFALLGISGVVSAVYLSRHNVLGQVFGWKLAIIMSIGALVAAVVAAILAITRVM